MGNCLGKSANQKDERSDTVSPPAPAASLSRPASRFHRDSDDDDSVEMERRKQERLQKIQTAEREAMEKLRMSRAMSAAKSRQSVVIKPNFTNTLEREPY